MKPKKPQSKIYSTAISLFAAGGYEKTTMDDIAESLSMTKGNLYLYACGKKNLYENSIRYGLKKWMKTVLIEVKKADSAEEKFKILCTTAWNYLKEDTNLRKIIQQDHSIFPIKTDDDRFSDINVTAMRVLEDVIREGVKDGTFREVNPEQAARYIYSIYIMFIIKTFVQDDSTADDSLFDTAVDFNLNGLLIH